MRRFTASRALKASELREEMIELGLKGDHPVTAQLEFFEGAIQFQFDAGDALFQLDGLGNLKFIGRGSRRVNRGTTPCSQATGV